MEPTRTGWGTSGTPRRSKVCYITHMLRTLTRTNGDLMIDHTVYRKSSFPAVKKLMSAPGCVRFQQERRNANALIPMSSGEIPSDLRILTISPPPTGHPWRLRLGAITRSTYPE
jgi:hypothetical protein